MASLAIGNSLNQSIEKAVKRYSALFRVPSYSKSLLFLALCCMSGGILSTILLFPLLTVLTKGLLLGFSFFLMTLLFDYIVAKIVLRKNSIYNLRRTTVLSFFSWILWLFFILVGVIISRTFGSLWQIRFTLFGFSVALILRLLVLSATISMSYKQLLASSILQPLSCMILFMPYWSGVNYFNLSLFIFFSLIVSFLSTSAFIFFLNRVGDKTLGIAALSLFKAFLLNWILGLNAPFEELLEKLGREQDVKISLVKFDASKTKAVIAVPSIHPGPFKNVGSSLLPSMIKTAIEQKLDCVACVPHGLLGHEHDLASQIQNQKIIKWLVASASFDTHEAEATSFLTCTNGLATACCQRFGKLVIISFTLAPHTTEDLPQELGQFVQKEAERLGLTQCVIINAHNSIDGVTDDQKILDSLEDVAVRCLEKIASLTTLPFQVGAATVTPREFSLEDGMGPGGITVVVIKVGKQETAYVVIDGNNMVSGLRESILSVLCSQSMTGGEIFTTDTHSVNALILTGRGYHPVGEAINHEKLIDYIKEATLVALSRLESAKTSALTITVPQIKAIGEEKLEALCLLIDRTVQKAKEISIPIFATTGLLLMFLLTLL